MLIRPVQRDRLGWIADRAGLVPGPNFAAWEALDDSGKVLGMIGLEWSLPNATNLHIAMEEPDRCDRAQRRKAMHALIRDAFVLAFDGYGKGVAIATVVSTNDRSKRLVKRLGFRVCGTVRDAWAPGADLIMYEMRRDECRWLEV